MNDRDALIAQLSADLTPVKPASLAPMTLLWLLLCSAWVIGVTHLTGDLRPGAFRQLAQHPHFLLETLAGVVAIVLLGIIGFRSASPGALSRPWTWLALAVLGAWLGSYLLGFVSPALEPSMLGKRSYCVFETLLYGLPPAALALWLAHRLYPLERVRTALLLSLTAGMIPALYMQLACMYEPSHILRLHILPGLLVALLGAGAVWLLPALLRPQSSRSE